MIRDLEDKMYQSWAERGRREARMAEYRGKIRRRFHILPSIPGPANHVELVAQPVCDVFRVDTKAAPPPGRAYRSMPFYDAPGLYDPEFDPE